MTAIHFDKLPRPLAEAARSVSLRLSQAGYQAWIVGGAVRDLVLQRAPKDVDIATDALPDVVEELFAMTTAVGKAFGTIVVHLSRAELGEAADDLDAASSGVDIEVTTFRSDGEYLDGRRPLEVVCADNLEEDASRRDFTCNALFANVLSGQLQDPEGGLADLQAGRLRAVGVPKDRFTEDGLRLMRLARFEARFALTPERETLEGARLAKSSIRGVSPERIRMELEGMFASDDPARALRRLEDLGLFELLFDALPGDGGVGWKRRCELFSKVDEEPMDLISGLSLLLGPRPGAPGVGECRTWAESCLNHLRPSRGVQRAVLGIWQSQLNLAALGQVETPSRCARIKVMRSPGFAGGLRGLHAWQGTCTPGDDLHDLWSLAQALQAEHQTLSAEQLEPAPLLTPADLAGTRIQRGPRWGQLLKAAEELQLDLELQDRAAALAWLQEQDRASKS